MGKTRILIVDDEQDILDLLKISLTRENYDCFTAKSKIEAFELIKKEHPAIILLDILLGNESGIDILCQMKEIDKKVKIIMLTASDDESNIVKAKTCGADDYARKFSDSKTMSEEVLEKISLLSLRKKE